jgi:hypothetical protein
MNYRFSLYLKRILIAQLIVFVAVFGLAQSARAQGVVYGSAIPAGQVVDNEAVLYGDQVTLDGTINGDAFLLGSNVTVNGEVTGSLVVIGQNVQINGKVGGTVYSAALQLTMGSTAALAHNLYFAGLELVTLPGSTIGRDLFTISLLGAQMNGTIGRDVHAIIGPIQLIRMLIQAISNSGIFNRPSSAPVPGTSIRMPGAVMPILAAGAGRIQPTAFTSGYDWIKHVSVAAWQTPESTGVNWQTVWGWMKGWLRELGVLLVYGLLTIWLFRPRLYNAAGTLRKKPLPSTGFGLLSLVIVGNVLGLVILLAAIIFLVGIWLGQATLWELTLAFWSVAYSTLMLATSLFWLFVIYGTKVIVAYLVGDMILKRFVPRAAEYPVAALLLGLFLYVLLHSISYLGLVLAILVTAIGLGAVVVMFFEERRQQKNPSNSAAEPESV